MANIMATVGVKGLSDSVASTCHALAVLSTARGRQTAYRLSQSG